MVRSWWRGGAEGSHRRGRRPAARSRSARRIPTLEALEGRDLPSFITAPQYPAGVKPVSVAVGDLSGDGHADLVVANDTSSGTVSVLKGNGSVQFRRPASYPAGPASVFVAVADLDGDQDLDLAVANATFNGTVSVLKNQGNGTFAAATSYPVGGAYPSSVAVGDVDADQDLDLAVT